jgi:hypothetical protein
MRIFIEGPHWMGKWTENVVSALEALGHDTGVHYHNSKPWRFRLMQAPRGLGRRLGWSRSADWPRESNRLLLEKMDGDRWDALLSIQGKVDGDTLATIRQRHPGIRIAYWWGDPLTDAVAAQLTALHPHVDMLALAAMGNLQRLAARGLERLLFLPFALSRQHHLDIVPSPAERRAYTCDVSFVATARADRCAAIRYLNGRLGFPIRVWGRSWRDCPGVRSGGRLSLEQCLKVYACSRISLNISGEFSLEDGFNMRFYEIPAAGGFQITEKRPSVTSGWGRGVASFTDLDDLAARIQYYLAHDAERLALASRIRADMIQHDTYEHRMEALLAGMGLAR